MAINSKNAQMPASAALLEITAIPINEVEFWTVSAAVTGLNKPATAQITAHKYLTPYNIDSKGSIFR